MIALKVTVPVACFRKGFAREFWETEELPPPATCYGFLLSLVGERDRRRHVGVRVCPGLLNRPERSAVLRTLWRVKKLPLGSPGNSRPDYQELLTDVRLALWVDSSEEPHAAPTLEKRVSAALENPASVERFGGLSLGESTHLVDEVGYLTDRDDIEGARVYLLSERGRLTLPVWVDHVGSAATRYVSGDLETIKDPAPPLSRMPRVAFD
jgi:CRISPR-associated protein Cas5t